MFHRTERLFLRPSFPEDWVAVHAAIDSADMARNLAAVPWPYTEADARSFASLPQDKWMPHFLVELPGTGVIGSAGLGRDEATGAVQLGYWIAQGHRGQGFATEAARGVLRVARMLEHRRLVSSHFLDNPASGKVLLKAGFRPTGEVRPGYSLARGGHNMVACYALMLDAEEPEPIADPLRQAA